MSLHTPISADLGPGGLQSLPIPSPRDRAEDIQVTQTPEVRSLDIGDENAGGGLCHEHKRLLSHWSVVSPGILNAAAMQETETAVISLFAAFIGIYLFQVTAREIPGFSTTFVPAIVAMDFFSFSGLALVLIGAVFAFVSARAKYRTANEFNTTYKKFRLFRLPGSGNAKCCNIPDDLGRLLYIMGRSLDINLAGFIFSMTGLAFFGLSFCILLITTQGVAVWAMVVMLMIWLGFQVSSDPRVWGKLPIISAISRRILQGVF